MQRGQTGRFETTTTAGEAVRAFVPRPCRHGHRWIIAGPLQHSPRAGGPGLRSPRRYHRSAAGTRPVPLRLRPPGGAALIQIEGTQSSLSDLLLFELEEAPGVPFDDVVEVSNYVAALEHGLARLPRVSALQTADSRDPRCAALPRRGADKQPGRVPHARQNWIGGTRPGKAHFVPPPQDVVPECMAANSSASCTPWRAAGALIRPRWPTCSSRPSTRSSMATAA